MRKVDAPVQRRQDDETPTEPFDTENGQSSNPEVSYSEQPLGIKSKISPYKRTTTRKEFWMDFLDGLIFKN